MQKLGRIHIKDLLLRAIVGVKPEEREKKQDVLLQLEVECNMTQAIYTDSLEHVLDYRSLTKEVIEFVENSQFYLLEKLTYEVLALCLAKPQVHYARVEVDKPGALRFSRSVSVTIERRVQNRAIIGVGSNIEPDHHIALAQQRLAMDHDLLRTSSLMETEPIGEKNQPNFLNGAFLVATNLNQDDFQGYLKDLEKDLGRSPERTHPFGPRTIDLDLLLWNGEVVHPDVENRDFVQKSVQEVWPYPLIYTSSSQAESRT